jgi:hypothetical protein
MTMQRRQFLKWVAAAASAFSLLPSAAFAAKDPIGRAERLDAAEFNAARKFVPTRFGRVALVERGAGKAALFLHGFSLIWFPVARSVGAVVGLPPLHCTGFSRAPDLIATEARRL